MDEVGVKIGGRLIRCSSESEWLQARENGITGTGASKACGVNPYMSRYYFWCLLTGQVCEESSSADEDYGPAYWGRTLEPHVIEVFRQSTGLRVHQDPPWSLRQDSTDDFILGTPDGYILDEHGRLGILEVKTGGAYTSHWWDDGAIPQHYLIQVYHYMAITGAGYAYFAVLLGGQKYKHIYVPRDERFIGQLREAEKKFWDHVINVIPVPVDGHETTKEAIKARYTQYDEERTVDLGNESAEHDAKLTEARDQIAYWQEVKQRSENYFKDAIGENAFGRIPGTNVKYSYRGRKTRRLNRRVEG